MKKDRIGSLGLILFVVAAGWSPPAMAQDVAAGSAAEARTRFERGVELIGQGNYATALGEFRASFAARANPAVRYNIGVCLYALGNLVGARTEFRRYLAETDPARITEERRAEVNDALAGIDAAVGLLDIRVSLPGASITVDGSPVGQAPLPEPVALMPGEHALSVMLAGYEPHTERVSVTAGERRALGVALVALAAPPPPVAGVSRPVEAEGARLSPTWFWISAGVAGALAVGGAITGGLVQASYSDFDEAVAACNSGRDPSRCDDGPGIKSYGENLGSATTALFIVAGAAAAGALTLFFFTDFGDEESPETSVGVTVAPLMTGDASTLSGAMVQATVRF
ncbi:MAG: PEGA domain-containing protein [Myxococcota bacterium]|nr:PEGA domain-containing protein [Myxococcota bacterium]